MPASGARKAGEQIRWRECRAAAPAGTRPRSSAAAARFPARHHAAPGAYRARARRPHRRPGPRRRRGRRPPPAGRPEEPAVTTDQGESRGDEAHDGEAAGVGDQSAAPAAARRGTRPSSGSRPRPARVGDRPRHGGRRPHGDGGAWRGRCRTAPRPGRAGRCRRGGETPGPGLGQGLERIAPGPPRGSRGHEAEATPRSRSRPGAADGASAPTPRQAARPGYCFLSPICSISAAISGPPRAMNRSTPCAPSCDRGAHPGGELPELGTLGGRTNARSRRATWPRGASASAPRCRATGSAESTPLSLRSGRPGAWPPLLTADREHADLLPVICVVISAGSCTRASILSPSTVVTASCGRTARG